jgi:hypothetical protein
MKTCKYCGETVGDNAAKHECLESFLRERIDELHEKLESSAYLKGEADKIARIMADAADANVKSSAYERIEHAKTASILRKILSESGSYLQTKTREAAMERIACTGNCVCLPNVEDHRAGPDDPSKAESAPVAGSGASTCWAGSGQGIKP